MSVKLSIFKSTADGEQVNIEYQMEARDFKEMEPFKLVDGNKVQIVPGKSLHQILSPYFRLVDDRLLEMNIRIMVTQIAVKKLDPEAQMAFHSLMQTLHGKNPSPEFRDVLKDAMMETAEKLIKQGFPPEKTYEVINKAVEGCTPIAPPPPPETAAEVSKEVTE